MVFSQNLLYACTMKTIPAIETNRPTKKYRERKQECSLPRAKSPMHSSRFVQAQHFRVAPESRVTFSYPSLALGAHNGRIADHPLCRRAVPAPSPSAMNEWLTG
jgi:hypothetical protein